ncbi:uncharacterized protein SPPG_06059 [Spizellomyces punctatus DAOM BR117]|uniref:Uncharacterized protein n=1 Tax=Spizellomyces punctatus (strain DAOM BR117) TaxID=645134 RepID=A0A0L0H9W4_SPIPD|nr:uncharacterized protein SPPG_06059 [Spizellomyces punctatus DAOM BR117]KNC98350.1 hypothetical protein SPPG_06059 [Spizellomyces punctatus DAOM BR117]|eukprot:XP_016606390.1 hypothetical protein SPPG_06059 [Spizellomyces punctatus DAOM BR117]
MLFGSRLLISSSHKMSAPRRHWFRLLVISLITITPAILLCVALSFTYVTTTSAEWAKQAVFSGVIYQGDNMRGPLKNCILLTDPSRLACSGPLCSVASRDSPPFCVQARWAKNFCIAACVLVSLGVLGILVLTVIKLVHLKRDFKHGGRRIRKTHPALAFLAFLVTILNVFSILCLLAALLVGGNAFLNLQPPNGNFATDLVIPDSTVAWLPGKGMTFGLVAWILGVLGISAGTVVFDMPKSQNEWGLLPPKDPHERQIDIIVEEDELEHHRDSIDVA